MPADTFANRLLLARRLNSLTIKQAAAGLAERLGIADEDLASSWSNWENGRRPRDEAETIRAIASVLDVDEQWLMFGGPLSPAARPRRGSSKRSSVDTLRYRLVTAGTGAGTGKYPPVTERPTDTRPPGHARRGGGTSPKPGHQPTHPGGSEHRRPRRLKWPNAA